jgi:hypothetical protein
MQDQPTPDEIIQAVTEFLRSLAGPPMTANTAYQARVAANVLDLASRELRFGPAEEARETMRLRALLGRDGSSEELNAAFADALDRGALSILSPGVKDHLWETTLAKLSVDQPTYSGYLAALKARSAGPLKDT